MALKDQMHPLLAARRVRRAFMGFAILGSISAFAVGSAILLDQWIAGHTTPLFIFGTACLIFAVCIVIFALVNATGLAISLLFREEPPRDQ